MRAKLCRCRLPSTFTKLLRLLLLGVLLADSQMKSQGRTRKVNQNLQSFWEYKSHNTIRFGMIIKTRHASSIEWKNEKKNVWLCANEGVIDEDWINRELKRIRLFSFLPLLWFNYINTSTKQTHTISFEYTETQKKRLYGTKKSFVPEILISFN